ncbi:hypothetical protein P691DRAFT_794982 [Macrolepiota fuliginosa MF-IS2]|uniref:DUF6570 domain-containing protein n=1 Tax=Macrolepiota fuliginosa MF-IS2 TaxID=1400762 RepID=A0A9P5X7M9_9AGAR|nr:hypothetical protein P691DRAFT_794982 [Macrolepiota fuliginosa MF-IS2]
MLDKSGVMSMSPESATICVCTECLISLSSGKVPKFVLVNCMYHGSLPVEFSDLTWVEEMVCAIYQNTAHVTRLYGSSDPAQPTVLHRNTCAHEMNIISTATVIPHTPSNINDMLSSKIWSFLQWLRHHNKLYEDIPFSDDIISLYPTDDVLP